MPGVGRGQAGGGEELAAALRGAVVGGGRGADSHCAPDFRPCRSGNNDDAVETPVRIRERIAHFED